MEEKPDFAVHDRRRSDVEPATDQVKEKKEEPTQPDRTSERTAPSGGTEQAALPDVDFATFILSLATSAQISLGAIPHPETNRISSNPPAAKQMIDVIGMLKERTRGNLTKDEETLIDQVLFNLRMHYVRVSEGTTEAGGS